VIGSPDHLKANFLVHSEPRLRQRVNELEQRIQELEWLSTFKRRTDKKGQGKEKENKKKKFRKHKRLVKALHSAIKVKGII